MAGAALSVISAISAGNNKNRFLQEKKNQVIL